jgi:hypothetical protein
MFFHFSFVPRLFRDCSLWLSIRYPMYSPRVFPIAPRFDPICFAQSHPLLTYIDGPKGGGTLSSIECFYFGEPP